MILVLIILLVGMKAAVSSLGGAEGSFSKDRCLPIKGVCAFYIVLCHINMQVHIFDVNPLLDPFNPWVIYSNGFFFFLSGYGLCSRVMFDKEYLNWKNLLKRLFNILGVTYIVYLFSFVSHGFNSSTEIVKYVFLSDIIRFVRENDQLWFVIEIVVLYILFWLIYRLFYVTKATFLLSVIILAWDVVAFVTGRGIVWYVSTLCFVEGISICRHRDVIFDYIKKKKRIYFVLVGVLSLWIVSQVLYLILTDGGDLWRYLIIGNISTLLFQVVLYLFMYIFVFGNPVSRFLGTISYELYLTHILVIKMIMYYTDNNLCVVYGTIVITLLVSILIHVIWKKINESVISIMNKV